MSATLALAALRKIDAPDALGEALQERFEEIRRWPSPAGRVFAGLIEGCGLDATHPLACSGHLLARHVDAGGAGGHRHAYHHVQHFCEVMLGAWCIAERAGMEPLLQAETVLAALMHDFGHDGQRNGRIAFRLERRAVELTTPWLVRGGMQGAGCRRLAALVLATEVSQGYPYTRACHERHLQAQGGALHGLLEPPCGALELGALAEDATLCLQALALCEADVLPSVGVTPAYAMRMQAALAEEWNCSLGPQDKLGFTEQWLQQAVASRFLAPNVIALRTQLLDAPSAVTPPDMLDAARR